jgi:hypothetical protein
VGKLASSRNAISHGILSSAIVLEGESQDRFCELFAGLLDEFQPQTPFEESLIENMAAACWRQMRIWSMEKTSIECEMHRQAESPYADLTQEDAAVCASRAFRRLSDDSHPIELVHRTATTRVTNASTTALIAASSKCTTSAPHPQLRLPK